MIGNIRPTACGADGIPFWVLKNNAHNLAEVLCDVFNKIIKEGAFPQSWNISIIRPIPKIKSPKECKYLRPAAIAPVLSRLFERLIYNNSMERSNNNHILDNQFGFRKFGFTSNAVIRIQNLCSDFHNANCEYVRIFSLDLSKAFDRVPHLITNSLKEMVGLYPYIVNLIANFSGIVLRTWN